MQAMETARHRRAQHDPHCTAPPWTPTPAEECRLCMKARETRELLIADLQIVFADASADEAGTVAAVIDVIRGINVLGGGMTEPDGDMLLRRAKRF